MGKNPKFTIATGVLGMGVAIAAVSGDMSLLPKLTLGLVGSCVSFLAARTFYLASKEKNNRKADEDFSENNLNNKFKSEDISTGFRLNVDGKSKVKFDEVALIGVQFLSNTPDVSGNARATDIGLGVKIWGRINFSLEAEHKDATLTLANWALQDSSEEEAYRKTTIQVVESGQIVREYTLPNAFIVEYSEEMDDKSGVGHFYLHLRQKKDLNVYVNAGFAG